MAAERNKPVLVDLALQGGGSHGAYTWGVLVTYGGVSLFVAFFVLAPMGHSECSMPQVSRAA
jgi:hypothetical protein